MAVIRSRRLKHRSGTFENCPAGARVVPARRQLGHIPSASRHLASRALPAVKAESLRHMLGRSLSGPRIVVPGRPANIHVAWLGSRTSGSTACQRPDCDPGRSADQADSGAGRRVTLGSLRLPGATGSRQANARQSGDRDKSGMDALPDADHKCGLSRQVPRRQAAFAPGPLLTAYWCAFAVGHCADADAVPGAS